MINISWGINQSASDKEKIKAEMNDFLKGLNSVGEIDYNTYSDIFDKSIELFNKMYKLGYKKGECTDE